MQVYVSVSILQPNICFEPEGTAGGGVFEISKMSTTRKFIVVHLIKMSHNVLNSMRL